MLRLRCEILKKDIFLKYQSDTIIFEKKGKTEFCYQNFRKSNLSLKILEKYKRMNLFFR